MEWKILQGKIEDVQKTLNQWKHMYHIHIHGVNQVVYDRITIVLTRERKE